MITPADILADQRDCGKPERKKKTGKQRRAERKAHRARRQRQQRFAGRVVCEEFEGRLYRLPVGTDKFRNALARALKK